MNRWVRRTARPEATEEGCAWSSVRCVVGANSCDSTKTGFDTKCNISRRLKAGLKASQLATEHESTERNHVPFNRSTNTAANNKGYRDSVYVVLGIEKLKIVVIVAMEIGRRGLRQSQLLIAYGDKGADTTAPLTAAFAPPELPHTSGARGV